MLIGSAIVLLLVFLRVLVDRDTHYAVDELRRDRDWRLFGPKSGDFILKAARAITGAVFVVSLILSSGHNPPIEALLAACGFALTTILVLGQLKLHYPAPL
jgi:hypothetical protein